MRIAVSLSLLAAHEGEVVLVISRMSLSSNIAFCSKAGTRRRASTTLLGTSGPSGAGELGAVCAGLRSQQSAAADVDGAILARPPRQPDFLVLHGLFLSIFSQSGHPWAALRCFSCVWIRFIKVPAFAASKLAFHERGH